VNELDVSRPTMSRFVAEHSDGQRYEHVVLGATRTFCGLVFGLYEEQEGPASRCRVCSGEVLSLWRLKGRTLAFLRKHEEAERELKEARELELQCERAEAARRRRAAACAEWGPVLASSGSRNCPRCRQEYPCLCVRNARRRRVKSTNHYS